MAEYLENAAQNIVLNQAATFDNSIPCNRRYVIHEDQSGIFTLRGIVNNPSCGFTRYQVIARGNIALPEGATVTPIAMALSSEGEVRPTSRAIYTPAAVEEFGNVVSSAIITVFRGCCAHVAWRAVAGSDDPTVTPAPILTLKNASMEIYRIS